MSTSDTRNLYQAIKEYTNDDYYPFHMPGHKRMGSNFPVHEAYELDISEIEGFDNLHEASGILQQSQQRAARAYGSQQCFFLINGSTGGILSAISACIPLGKTLIMGRNSHRSAYHGVLLRNAKTVYMYPDWQEDLGMPGGIQPEEVERALRHNPNTAAVFLTSPTYDGFVSDIGSIVQIAHSYGKPVIVDEAHGAHFEWGEGFPQSAIAKGADIVIQSLHKTLPSLTQTALLHWNSKIVPLEKIQTYLSIYQSSSPSYLLISSIDYCIEFMVKNGRSYLKKLQENICLLREGLNNCRFLKVIDQSIVGNNGIYDYDIGKVIISVKGTSISGQTLYTTLLETYHLQMEMAADSYVLGIVTGSDTQEGIKRLVQAIVEIDTTLGIEITTLALDTIRENDDTKLAGRSEMLLYTERTYLASKITIGEAEREEKEIIELQESEGRISGGFIYLYPPGVPLVVPGEEITKEILEQIYTYQTKKLSIHGLLEKEKKVKVLSVRRSSKAAENAAKNI